MTPLSPQEAVRIATETAGELEQIREFASAEPRREILRQQVAAIRFLLADAERYRFLVAQLYLNGVRTVAGGAMQDLWLELRYYPLPRDLSDDITLAVDAWRAALTETGETT